MINDPLEQLRGMDQAILTDIVCKDQDNPDLIIFDWMVEPLIHEKIISTTGGLFQFSGLAQDTQSTWPWTIILKRINNPKSWKQEPHGWAYWQREVKVFQSGFLAQMPPGLHAPRFYGVMENDDGAGLWIEYIQETTGKKWSLNDFQRTARQLGYFHGAYLCGTPLIDKPWLSKSFLRDVWMDQGFWAGIMNPEAERNAWESQIVQRGFDNQKKSRVLKLIAEKQRFFDVNDRLPQVLCHNDAHRRNFMWSHSTKTGEDKLIGVDWAFIGIGALGNDLGELVGTSMYHFDYDPTDADTLEAAVLEGYKAGIADHNIEVNERLIRLGYLISLSFRMGSMLPGWAAILLSSDSPVDIQAMCGRSAEDVLIGWTHLHAFCLDRADEARTLIDELGF